jgi:hypothetical protein
MNLTPISHLREEVLELYQEHGSYLGAANALYERHPFLAKPNQLRSYIKTEVQAVEPDLEMVTETVRLAKKNQALADQNRIQNKAFREHARIENAVEQFSKSILHELQNHGVALSHCPRRTGVLDPEAAALVVHLSDNHFNELVNLPTNTSGAFSQKNQDLWPGLRCPTCRCLFRWRPDEQRSAPG